MGSEMCIRDRLRTCRGISQGELARALVISQTHLSNIECCRVAVNFRLLLRAANALEYTLDDLLQLEFTELTKTVMEVREYFSAQDGYALNVTGKLVIKEKAQTRSLRQIITTRPPTVNIQGL